VSDEGAAPPAPEAGTPDPAPAATESVKVTVSAPTSALKGRSLAQLLLGGVLTAGAAGGAAGYASGGFNAEQKLELAQQMDELRADLTDKIERQGDALNEIRAELWYVRGKLGMANGPEPPHE